MSLPKGEGELSAAGRQIEASRHLARRPTEHPLLGGEGWGEGERGRRTVAAAQYVFGTRETEPEFLAALDVKLRRPEAATAAYASDTAKAKHRHPVKVDKVRGA